MAKIISKLSALAVASAKMPGLYGDGGGLYLQVSANGSKSWIFKFKANGRSRYMGLGSLKTISLAKARDTASKCRELRLQGIDPIVQRDGVRAAARLDAVKTMNFDECRDAYIAAHQAGWRNAKHRVQWVNTLDTYASPVFGKLPIQAVERGAGNSSVGADLEHEAGNSEPFTRSHRACARLGESSRVSGW